jgi:ribonuclease P protein component
MYVRENGSGKNRVGISVSKKVGNSVVRHRVLRLIRENYRLHENLFNSGLDIVIIVRASVVGIGFKEVEGALLHLGKLHKIIKVFFYMDN